MKQFPHFRLAIEDALAEMSHYAFLVPPSFWQSVDISSKPEMGTYELMNYSFTVNMTNSPFSLADDIKPNLPWADDHFAERVCGEPINPGVQWKNWPWGNSADKFRNPQGQFNHNYMERLWPRKAGQTADGTIDPNDTGWAGENHGIRSRLGDLNDVLDLLIRDPLTRQAYIPIYFPEDTGTHHGGRVPCTLGYHLIRRNTRLHIVYYMRSCDLLRHFRDDIYLTARLCMWFITQLKARDPANWEHVLPGDFTMHITSLHLFRNDWRTLFNGTPPIIGGINEYHQRPRIGSAPDGERIPSPPTE
jgi:hypothetical protein